jgi:uncharacterized membrane protein SirB2
MSEGPALRTGRRKEFMNLYSLIVFSHIVATLGLFAGLTIEWVMVSALKRADPAETQICIHLWPRVLPLTILSAVLLITSGIYLAAMTSVFPQGWTQISMLAVFIIAVLGAVSKQTNTGLRQGHPWWRGRPGDRPFGSELQNRNCARRGAAYDR